MRSKRRDGRDKAPRVLFGARIPADLHKQAKHYAVDQGIKMRDLLEAALKEFLAKKG